ncbi:hypothetical protein KY343_06305 [Candidatus Woesearchaeota archaeon]|nr:hypothetical protein [Candidatus Woesearchaeota archaeon]
MKSIVERSLKVMEKGIPRVHGKMTCSIEGHIISSSVDYVYNPQTGLVLEVWSHGSFDPGKSYHSFNVIKPFPARSEEKYEIIDYHPPEGITVEAKNNLEDAVRLWNEKHGFSNASSR